MENYVVSCGCELLIRGNPKQSSRIFVEAESIKDAEILAISKLYTELQDWISNYPYEFFIVYAVTSDDDAKHPYDKNELVKIYQKNKNKQQ